MESGWGTVKCSDNLKSGISVEGTGVSRSLSQILVHNITRCGDRLTFSLRFFLGERFGIHFSLSI